jgi:thiol-disulfide isomerase/thioredoxin
MQKKFLFTASFCALLVVGLYVFISGALRADIAPGKPVELKFTSVDGKAIDLSKMKGKVVLIDFWATWCPPCRAEVPDVVATYKKFHDQGFEIAGISLDQNKDSLLAFTKEHEMTWPQYFDGKGWDNDISKGFGIDEIPAMWLVGKDGNLISTDARDDLAGQVEKALKVR